MYEALQPGYKTYIQQVVTNAKVLSRTIEGRGYRIVSGGTDNHLMLVDVFSKGITGKQAEKALEEAGITVNKNSIPFDTNPPMVTSGIRLGTPALTTRGMKETEMRMIGNLICDVLDDFQNSGLLSRIHKQVLELTKDFSLGS